MSTYYDLVKRYMQFCKSIKHLNHNTDNSKIDMCTLLKNKSPIWAKTLLNALLFLREKSAHCIMWTCNAVEIVAINNSWRYRVNLITLMDKVRVLISEIIFVKQNAMIFEFGSCHFITGFEVTWFIIYCILIPTPKIKFALYINVLSCLRHANSHLYFWSYCFILNLGMSYDVVRNYVKKATKSNYNMIMEQFPVTWLFTLHWYIFIS